MGLRDVMTDQDRTQRRGELDAEDASRQATRAAEEDAARRSNRDFVQVYPKGWKRLQQLMKTNPSAARVFAFLAQHMDGAAGVVVVSQEVIAAELEVHVRTIKRQTKLLEDAEAIIRIRVGTGVYAYALDPAEVWKSWDDKKDLAAFHTKTLVRKSDRANGQIRRKLKIMMGMPELPL